MKICIRNGRAADPQRGLDKKTDVMLEYGRVTAVGDLSGLQADYDFNAEGMLVVPGLVDMHVHLRDPGQTHKENLYSGTAAAAAGGVTSVCCMPNTAPAIDSPETLRDLLERSRWGSARVYPCAAITKGLGGWELTDFAALRNAGAVAVSDDGRPVENPELLERAVVLAKEAGLKVLCHCEDLKTVRNGIVHKGSVSDKLGLPGIDRRSEDESTAREISIAERTGAPLHICHVSTKGAVELIRSAKARGVPVTAETAPHYFLLTDEELTRQDANFRMNPPLREDSDRNAVLDALCDGALDAIATDHAPHTPAEKADFRNAPNGVIGLETSFMLAYSALVRTGRLSLLRLVELMSASPARLLGIPGGTLSPGSPADVAVFDVGSETVITPEAFRSKARNTPFAGRRCFGRCMLTICGGKIVHNL